MDEVLRRRQGVFVAIIFLMSVSIMGALSVFTSPQNGGPFMILLMQLLIFVAVATGVLGLTIVANRFIGARISRARAFVTALCVGIGATLLIGLQTLNQLNVADVLLIILLEAGIIFYAFRRLGSYKS